MASQDYAGPAPRRTRREGRRRLRRARRLRGLRRMAFLLFAALLLLLVGASVLSLTVLREIESVSSPAVSPPPVPPRVPATEKAASGSSSSKAASPDAYAPVDMAELEDRIRSITSRHAGFYGVAVYDPASEETAKLNADEKFGAASIGKLPALISLYRAAVRDEVDLEDKVSIQRSDYQTGTGILQTKAVGYSVSLRRCAFLMINESDNTAWEMLHRYLGWDYIEAETHAIGASSTGYWDPNTTTPSDVMLMLKKISDPSFTTAEMSSEMLAAMTDTVNEDRIPAPLPEDVRVAHKFGSYGDSFGDAGVVFFEAPGGAERRYFLVVLSEGAGEGEARDTMREISLATYQAFTEPTGPTTRR